jgi:hypothetical protein
MSGVRISQRPLLRNPRLLTGVFVFIQVCQSCHSLSLYDINNHKEDTITEDTKPNSITYFNQSGGHTPFDGEEGMIIFTISTSLNI